MENLSSNLSMIRRWCKKSPALHIRLVWPAHHVMSYHVYHAMPCHVRISEEWEGKSEKEKQTCLFSKSSVTQQKQNTCTDARLTETRHSKLNGLSSTIHSNSPNKPNPFASRKAVRALKPEGNYWVGSRESRHYCHPSLCRLLSLKTRDSRVQTLSSVSPPSIEYVECRTGVSGGGNGNGLTWR